MGKDGGGGDGRRAREIIGLVRPPDQHAAPRPPEQEQREDEQAGNAGLERQLDIVAMDMVHVETVDGRRVLVGPVDLLEGADARPDRHEVRGRREALGEGIVAEIFLALLACGREVVGERRREHGGHRAGQQQSDEQRASSAAACGGATGSSADSPRAPERRGRCRRSRR